MKKLHLVLWGVAAIAATVFCVFYYSSTFPEAALDLKITRQQAFDIGKEFVERQGFDLTDYRSAFAFRTNYDVRSFLEKKLDLESANRLMAGEVNVWAFFSRWFKIQEQEEFRADVAPDGRIIYWGHTIPEAAEGASLTADEAQRVAEEWLTANGLAQDGYEIIDRQSVDRPHRRDHDITWKKKDFDCHGATYRIFVRVSGDKVSHYYEFLRTPETWASEETGKSAYKSALQAVASVGNGALSLGMLIMLAIGLRRSQLRSKFILVFVIPVAVLPILMTLNNHSILWLGYQTTETLGKFYGDRAATLAISVGGAILGMSLLAIAADYVARRAWPGQIPISLAHKLGFWQSRPLCVSVFVGLCLAALHMAYVTGFYLAAQKLGAWAPQETPAVNALATPMPWLEAIRSGVSAALKEEFKFRLFGISLLMLLTKRRWVAILVSAMIWGFLHSTYPQEPFYIRGLELTAAGILYGVVAMKYGIVATLVAHFTYNSSSFGIILAQSGGAYAAISGIVVSGLAVALFFPPLWVKLRGRKLPTANEVLAIPVTSATVAVQAPEPPPVYRPYVPLSPRRIALLVCIAVVGLAAWAWNSKQPYFGDYVKVTLNKKEAETIANDLIRNKGIDIDSYRKCSWFCDALGGDSAEYFWENNKSLDALNETCRIYMPDAVHWHVKYFKPLDREYYEVRITPDGSRCYYDHTLPENAPGEKLTQAEAQPIAEQCLQNEYGLDLAQYKLVNASEKEWPNRKDHFFTWEHNSNFIGEARCRVSMSVRGNEPGSLTYFLKLPEKWLRDKRMTGLMDVLLGASMAIAVTAAVCLVAWSLFRSFARRQTAPLRTILPLALIPALFMLPEQLSLYEQFWRDYYVDVEPMLYTVQKIVTDFVFTPVGVFLAGAFLIFASELTYRLAFRDRIPLLCWFGVGRRQFHDTELARMPRLPYALVWGEALLTGSLVAVATVPLGTLMDMAAAPYFSLETPLVGVIGGSKTTWPMFHVLAHAPIAAIMQVAGVIFAVSLVKRFIPRRLWLPLSLLILAFLVACDADTLNEAMKAFAEGAIAIVALGPLVFLLVKYVFRDNIPAIMTFFLCYDILAPNMLVTPDPHIQLNGIILMLFPVALALVGLALYIPAIEKWQQQAIPEPINEPANSTA